MPRECDPVPGGSAGLRRRLSFPLTSAFGRLMKLGGALQPACLPAPSSSVPPEPSHLMARQNGPRKVSCLAAAGVRPRGFNVPNPKQEWDGWWFLQEQGIFACWRFRVRNRRVLNNWSWSFHAASWQFSAQGHCRHHWDVPAAICTDSIPAVERKMSLVLNIR